MQNNEISATHLAASPAPEVSPAQPIRPATQATVKATCWVEPEAAVQWYSPALIGAEQLAAVLFTGGHISEAQRLLSVLDPDDYSRFLMKFYDEGLKRFGPTWRYADIVTVLLCLSRLLKPSRYLEIGVRRGRSLCAVARRAPECRVYGFDMWQADYAGMSNPGADFVRSELRKIGYRGEAQFVDGDSHVTLPAFFDDNPDLSFDLITVDGDHTNLGAEQDLRDVIPHLAIGGALVFDDIAHPFHPELNDVWQRVVCSDPRFTVFNYRDVGYGVGCAIRKS
jgi:predicted O-methyltransferase YrrM